jgi:HAD superfamily hydrolase (TIGR01458 family)
VRPSLLLLDIDGVLYVENEPIAGAVAAVERLRAAGMQLRFATNTTSAPRARILAKLHELGFQLDAHELITPASLAVRHCELRGHREVALLLAEAVREDFAQLTAAACEERADAVILGDLGAAWGYDRLNGAFRAIMAGAELIALQKNRFWMRGDGLALDAGAFVAALEYASGREAIVVGKPAPAFFAEILAACAVPATEAAMVGDDVEADVGGAQRAGLFGILVQTGKYRAELVRASGVEPSATVASIADVPALLGA